MFQRYPTSDRQVPVTDRPPATPTVLNAVKLMYAGAAVSAIEIVIAFTTIGGLRTAIEKAYPHDTAAQWHSYEVQGIVGLIISGLLGVGLWVLMARMNLTGRSWARMVASVLFAINTLDVVTTLLRPSTVLGLVFAVVLWLIGLGAIVLLWRRESAPFFQPAQPR